MHVHARPRACAVTRATLAVLAALAVGIALVPGLRSATAQATTAPPSSYAVPSAIPADWTPQIQDGAVLAITQVGETVVLGGSFTEIEQVAGGADLDRGRITAIDAGTGKISAKFAPTFNGEVHALAPGPTSGTVLVGGAFTTVDDVAHPYLVLLDLATGTVVSSFAPPTFDGPVESIVWRGSRILVGGSFTRVGSATRQGLASLDGRTGALDGFLTVGLTVNHNWFPGCSGCIKGAVGAKKIALSPDGTTLAVIGNFKYADGNARDQIALIDLTGATARVVTGWATNVFTDRCDAASFDSWIRDVGFGPDGSYLVVVATGGANSGGCDAATRLATNVVSTDVRPTWVASSGGNTFLSVAVTPAAIYFGGHMRWLNNDDGDNDAAPGAVPRPGLGALDPASGRPLTWNPGRHPRGLGAAAIMVTDAGVWVGSDTDYIGAKKYLRQKIAFFPFAGGATVATGRMPALPGSVVLAGGSTAVTRSFDGRSAGADLPLSSGFDWSSVHGAVQVDSWLYFVRGGVFYRAPIDGPTVGAAVALDPYRDPTWCKVFTSGASLCGVPPSFYGELGSVTALGYQDGRLYYVLAGSTSLHYRLFSPDSGVVSPASYTMAGTIAAGATALIIVGHDLYYATGSGNLVRTNLTATAVGAATTVSGPTVDGKSWAYAAVFLSGIPAATVSPSPTPTPTATATPPAPPIVPAQIKKIKVKKDGRLVVRWQAAKSDDDRVVTYRVTVAKRKSSGSWARWRDIDAAAPDAVRRAVWSGAKAGAKYRIRVVTDFASAGSRRSAVVKARITR